jgi:hypothetical protein
MASLQVNAPLVVAELFDTEVVVIHLERGTYYSLTGAACRVWPLLGTGLDRDGIVQRLGALGPDWAAAAPELRDFLETLLVEELVREGEETRPAPPLVPEAYQPAGFEKFTDMEELIALDPVHDVSAAEGWPLRTPVGPDSP